MMKQARGPTPSSVRWTTSWRAQLEGVPSPEQLLRADNNNFLPSFPLQHLFTSYLVPLLKHLSLLTSPLLYPSPPPPLKHLLLLYPVPLLKHLSLLTSPPSSLPPPPAQTPLPSHLTSLFSTPSLCSNISPFSPHLPLLYPLPLLKNLSPLTSGKWTSSVMKQARGSTPSSVRSWRAQREARRCSSTPTIAVGRTKTIACSSICSLCYPTIIPTSTPHPSHFTFPFSTQTHNITLHFPMLIPCLS